MATRTIYFSKLCPALQNVTNQDLYKICFDEKRQSEADSEDVCRDGEKWVTATLITDRMMKNKTVGVRVECEGCDLMKSGFREVVRFRER